MQIAPSTNRAFHFTIGTAHPDRVWHFWTTPGTWHQWDAGLKSASLDGPMSLGSTGRLAPLSGPATTFRVVAFQPMQSYAFETRLPGCNLWVGRMFVNHRTEFTHRVTFKGPTAFLFARLFGPGFRKALPPTMERLNELAGA